MNASRNIAVGKAAGGILAAVVVCWVVWQWFFCRFYVPVDHMAVLTAKEGDALPATQILARPGQKGVLEEPLGEGRHFRNPVLYEWEVVPAVIIPAGKCGVVTAKVGTELPPGAFLAERGEKGIWRSTLGPGKYRLNPVGYKVEIVDAMSIPIGYVGVVTSLSGEEAAEGQFAGPGQKGVRQDVLQPGLYYINPYEYKVDVLEIGLNQVSLTGREGGQVITKGQLTTQNVTMQELSGNVLREQQKKRQDYLDRQQQQATPQQTSLTAPVRSRRGTSEDQPQGAEPMMTPQEGRAFVGTDALATLTLAQYVEFPSRDGFEIRLDMTVEFEFLPRDIAQIFRRYGDLPAVVDKIIMPQILSVSRLKGSSYGAKEFIVGEGRERFQADLKESLAGILQQKYILVHNALIRHVSVPQEILDPIQQAALALEQNSTNIERQNTARKQAELNTEEALIDQAREEVTQETTKLVAEIKAEEEREVAGILAEAERQVAEIMKETAEVKASTTRRLGEAAAKVITLVDGEKARGLHLKVAALGSPEAFTLAESVEKLDADLRIDILHAGPGTLWTDLKSARLSDLGAARDLQEAASPPGPSRGAAGDANGPPR
ncbi:MAG: hypothetical protein JXR77_19210 [Lentisphaeria bacterium]|nr:hypothetical protein [Lentisphaeria bacterium]